MTGKIKSIPKWILLVSGFIAALGLIVSATLIFSPQSALTTVDLTAKGVQYLIYMWAARQFSLGFIFGFATWKQSQPMLTLAYIFFLVMNIADFIIGTFQQDNGLIFGALFMCIVSSVLIYFINKD